MTELTKLFNVEDYVNESLIIAKPDTLVTELYQMMQKNRVRHLPVVSNGKAIGVISDKDVKFISYSNSLMEMTAEQVMTSDPYTVTKECSLKEIVKTMNSRKINSTLIENDDGKVVGIFTTTDALSLLATHIS